MNTRTRGYCFTTNNYSDDDIIDATALWAEYGASYVIIGFEQGQQGTHHLQCYVFFPNKLAFTTLKSYLPRSHIEVAKGNPEQNFDYCSKEKYIELGELPKSGKRTDLIDMYEDIKTGKPITDIMQQYPSNFLRYSGAIEKAYAYTKPVNKECIVTYTVYDPFIYQTEILEDAYIMDSTQIDIYGYRGEKYIVCMHAMNIDLVKRLAYNIPLTVKNGYITTKTLPEQVIIYDPNGYHYYAISKDEELLHLTEKLFTDGIEASVDGTYNRPKSAKKNKISV